MCAIIEGFAKSAIHLNKPHTNVMTKPVIGLTCTSVVMCTNCMLGYAWYIIPVVKLIPLE